MARAASARVLGEALVLAKQAGDEDATATLLHDLGRVAMRRGDDARSAALFERR